MDPASLQRVFNALRGLVIAIVAVEAYDQVQWGFEPAPESWECPRMLGELALAFAGRSRAAAQQRVNEFARENVLYVIRFDSQNAAAESSISLKTDRDGA